MSKQGFVKWYGDKVLLDIKEATPDALFDAGQELIDAAAAKAPRRTGELADSGYVASKDKTTYRAGSTHRKQIRPSDDRVVAGFAAFYARFVELGTKKQPARPFLRPALDELTGSMGLTVVNHIKRKVDK